MNESQKQLLELIFELFYEKGVLSSTEFEHISNTISSRDLRLITNAIQDVIEGDI